MINVIVCDDDKHYCKKIVDIIDKYMFKNEIEYKKHIFYDYDDKFMQIIQKKVPFKIYILDIETPTRSGIDIAREIRRKDTESIIIFLTGHEELGNLILKDDLLFLSFINKFDNSEERINKSLTKAVDLLKEKRVLKFKDANIIYTIKLDSILYFTKDTVERKTIIKTDYQEYKTNLTLNNLSDLVDKRFIRTHKACIINTDRTEKIDRRKKIIIFDNGETIDLISRKYSKELTYE